MPLRSAASAPAQGAHGARYLEHEHEIVSYNGDLRGIVEDFLNVHRMMRVSVPIFQSVGALVEETALLATVATMVAREIIAVRPHLRTKTLPFALARATIEMLWQNRLDEAIRFVQELIAGIAAEARADRKD